MILENKDCVTIHPMVSCAGQNVLCHVIFSGKEITSKMAPQSAVDKIPNLLISITDHGVQDHKSLLDFYKFFDNKLNECGIKRPVVVLTDGHNSKFDPSVLQFCREKEILLFVRSSQSWPSPPVSTRKDQIIFYTM